MAERVSAKLKRKKIAKEAKNYTRSLREVKCAYTKKNDSSLELNEAIVEVF